MRIVIHVCGGVIQEILTDSSENVEATVFGSDIDPDVSSVEVSDDPAIRKLEDDGYPTCSRPLGWTVVPYQVKWAAK